MVIAHKNFISNPFPLYIFKPSPKSPLLRTKKDLLSEIQTLSRSDSEQKVASFLNFPGIKRKITHNAINTQQYNQHNFHGKLRFSRLCLSRSDVAQDMQSHQQRHNRQNEGHYLIVVKSSPEIPMYKMYTHSCNAAAWTGQAGQAFYRTGNADSRKVGAIKKECQYHTYRHPF